MSILKSKITTFALIAGLSAVPAIAFSDTPQSGSPQQAVDNDPDETVDRAQADAESLYNTPKADQGENAYDDAEVEEEFADDEGSLIKEDAKSDG